VVDSATMIIIRQRHAEAEAARERWKQAQLEYAIARDGCYVCGTLHSKPSPHASGTMSPRGIYMCSECMGAGSTELWPIPAKCLGLECPWEM
jgi:hypothetical protein